MAKYRTGASLEDLTLDFSWLGRQILLRKRDIIGFNPADETVDISDVVLRAANLLGTQLENMSYYIVYCIQFC